MPKFDWKTLAIVIALLAQFAGIMWKGGQLVERQDNIQQQLQQQDRRLERIENMFIARPGGTP